MINSFSQYLVEEEKTIYFTFGRMNPPTAGHEMLLNKLAAAAGRNQYRIYLSKSNDPKKNPLQYNEKVKFARKMFPKHARQIIKDSQINSIMDIATRLYNDGFVNVVMAVDGPRSRQFDILLNKYNGKEAKHGFYNFKSIKFINVGERNDASADIDGVSATKQRKAAQDNDFVAFSQGLPKSTSNKDARDLFNAVRRGMGLKEAKEFKNHIQLEPVSEIREAYVKDGIFQQGDEVVMLKTERVGKIKYLGANYVIVESKGETWRCWLNDITKVDPDATIDWSSAEYGADPYDGPYRNMQESTKSMYADKPDWGTPESTKKAKKMTPGETAEQATPQDKDIDDRKGTQPARYHKGLSKATKIARDRHFKKHGKKADDDASAYKPAPGDATAKTIPSKHTKFVKRLMGEQSMERTRERIAQEKQRAKEQDRKEKEQMKQKHDTMLDRARRSTMLQKNRGVSENLEEASFADKSKASGISVATLKKVYDRGVAAWKTGHRPGTTPSQWGHARVNAFIAKRKKGTLNHDKDLA